MRVSFRRSPRSLLAEKVQTNASITFIDLSNLYPWFNINLGYQTCGRVSSFTMVVFSSEKELYRIRGTMVCVNKILTATIFIEQEQKKKNKFRC